MTMPEQMNVLITGCSSGIGYSLARDFRQRRHRVFASARRPESLSELKAENFDIVALDVTDPASIQRAVDEVLAAAGRIDLLINNAGFGLFGPTIELPLPEIRRQFETNVVGALALIQAVVPHMVRHGFGRIVNVTSVSAVLTTPFAGAYCASKAAMQSFSEALRMELAPLGVDVVAVQPGAIQSRFGDNAASLTGQFGGPGSLYHPIAEFLIKRAQTSQENATPTDEFSRTLVDLLTQPVPPRLIRLGEGSTRFPLLKRLMPEGMLDRMLMKRFGLELLRAKLKEKAK